MTPKLKKSDCYTASWIQPVGLVPPEHGLIDVTQRWKNLSIYLYIHIYFCFFKPPISIRGWKNITGITAVLILMDFSISVKCQDVFAHSSGGNTF